MAVPESDASGGSEAFCNVPGDPLGSVLSLGRAAVQSMQPDAAEIGELTQLITPLVLGKYRVYLCNHILCCWNTSWVALLVGVCHYPLSMGGGWVIQHGLCALLEQAACISYSLPAL